MNGHITINGKKHKVSPLAAIFVMASILALYAVVGALPIMWTTGASFGKSLLAACIVAFICKMEVNR